MNSIRITVQISKYAYNLIKANKAFLGPGGVRLLDGRLVELYRLVPALVKHSSTIAPINPLSIAINAVDLFVSFKNGQKLNRVIQMVSALQGIAWAGTAIGAANLALTATSFSAIHSKLDGISQQIASAVADLKREMRTIQLEDKTVEILTLIGNLKSVSHYLGIRTLDRQDEIQIENYLNNARQLILWLNEQCEKEALAAQRPTLFTLLFDLTSMYTAVLKEYCSQYFYLEGCLPGNLSGWADAFGYSDSSALQSGLKQTIWLANPIASTEKLEAAYDFSINTVRLQYQDLQETTEILPQIPREACVDFDAFVKERIDSGNVEVIEQALEEDPRERVLLQKNGFATA